MKKWQIKNKAKVKDSLTDEVIIEKVLENRGLKTKEEIETFLNPPNPRDLSAESVGISDKELTKAVKRIKKAVKEGEKIVVYGDYDTDGVCATAIIWETLDSLGAKAMPFIPLRGDGYGINVGKMDQLKSEGVGLVITVDQGVVANSQVEYAQQKGLDIIITDHHVAGEKFPEALAVVHTTQLSGAGVSWFLASRLGKPSLDLATIGTVTDVMPLIGMNRSIVKHGLLEVRGTNRPGLLVLYEMARIVKEKMGTYELGFIIGPRLNAAGRIDDPMESLRLVCTRNYERAVILAQKIDQQNRQRQLLADQMTAHARQTWLAGDGKGKLIFVAHESYEEGIVGLVAGRLAEEFCRPVVVVSQKEIYSKASARSIDGFNIVEAIRSCADVLGPHGGHALAAGFTTETVKLGELKTRLLQLAESQLDEEKMTPILPVDLEVRLVDLTLGLLDRISQLGPFGFGNPEPVFLTQGLEVQSFRFVGSASQHLKLQLVCPDSHISIGAIGFNKASQFSSLTVGREVDVVYNLAADDWSGEGKLQLKIKDMKVSDGEGFAKIDS